MRNALALASVFALLGCSRPPPDVIFQQDVDLDGDGRSERVVGRIASVTGDYGVFHLDAGPFQWETRFFAAEGDKPDVSVVSFDAATAEHQLLVSLVDAASCSYEYLRYGKRGLSSIGKLESNHCLDAPMEPANGRVSLNEWEGFWGRLIEYEYDRQAGSLQQVAQPIVPVGIQTTTTDTIELSFTSSAAPVSIERGTAVTIRAFDPAHERYLIELADGRADWHAVTPSSFGKLPWGD